MVQRRLAEEYERCQQYLDAATRKPLIAAVEKQLLERHMDAILDKGFDALVMETRVVDLGRLYSLAARIHALEALRNAFKEYIKKAGATLVMDTEKVPCSHAFAAGAGTPSVVISGGRMLTHQTQKHQWHTFASTTRRTANDGLETARLRICALQGEGGVNADHQNRPEQLFACQGPSNLPSLTQ